MPIEMGSRKPEEIGSWREVYKTDSTERVQRLRKRTFITPEICLERSRAEIKGYEKYKDEPRVIQRAKVFETYLQDKSIFIYDDELIVGNVCSKYRGSPVFTELNAHWMKDEIDDPERVWTNRPLDKHLMTEEEKRELKEEILPYWEGKSFEDYCLQFYDDELMEKGVGRGECTHTPMVAWMMCQKDLGHMMPSFEKILHKGLKGIREECEGYLKRMDDEYIARRSQERRDFYNACLISLDAVMDHANRYVELAKSMAAEENDPQRKKELLKIAEVLSRVPAEPARDWYEALQCVWFIQMIIHCEMEYVTNCFGRFDQYMLPFYEKTVLQDKALTRDEAKELLECFLIKVGGFTVFLSFDTVKNQAGYSTAQTLTLGGQKRDGSDACNDVTMLFLDADQNIMFPSPDVAFMMWEGTPDKYLRRAAEVTRLGGGKPKFFNNRIVMEQMKNIYSDLSEEDIREGCAIMGCVEGCIPGITQHNGFGALQSMGTVMEIMLHNGKCPRCGKQIGPKTGDPRTFTCIEDVQEAFKTQVQYFAEIMVKTMKVPFDCEGERMQVPFSSCLTEGTFAKGLDLTEGGAPYTVWGTMYGAPIDIGDSLGVIDTLIFKEKKVTWDELLQALDDNWEGHEELRALCINGVPKYGNDIEYADNWVNWVSNMTCDVADYIRTRKDLYPKWGGYIANMHTAVTLNVAFGNMTGALPNGHLAFTPVIDCVSPGQGLDKKGPSGALKSATHVPYPRLSMGAPFNQKFTPALVATDRDMDNYVSFLRAFEKYGLEQIQVNIVSADFLRHAMKYPEEHQGLLIRVASYMAFFTELDEQSQLDIIARTEQTSWA